MLYLVIWVLCGLAAGAIYKNKGRSYGAAFVAGLLLGPIALILAAVSSTDSAGKEQQAIASGGMKKCPQCAELIKAEAQICRYCNYSFAPKPAGPPPPPGAVVKLIKGGTVTCSACGGTVRSDAKSCRHCGKEFTMEHPIGA